MTLACDLDVRTDRPSRLVVVGTFLVAGGPDTVPSRCFVGCMKSRVEGTSGSVVTERLMDSLQHSNSKAPDDTVGSARGVLTLMPTLDLIWCGNHNCTARDRK